LEGRKHTMSFNIERGLFKFDFTDHHAILGIPLDIDPSEIRQRYKKIARRLHPDSCAAEGDAAKQLANQLLAKLVNPAYKQLNKDDSRAEHNATLTRIGKSLTKEREKLEVKSEEANQLKRSSNWEGEYRTAMKKLAETQYESLEEVLDKIAKISELNLIYLMRKASLGAPIGAQPVAAAKSATPAGATSTASGKPAAVQQQPARQEHVSMTEPYCRRAEEYMTKNSFAKAILELKDALKMEPNNSRCHGLLARAYRREGQATMARIHMNQAMKLNPLDPTVAEVKKEFDQAAMHSVKGTVPAQNPKKPDNKSNKPNQKKPDNPSGGFFGLFGGKKK
jgi:curved DNA-binding protein CbpA